MFRSKVPFRVRLQALVNLLCTAYMTFMTLCVTHISFFYIVPECYYGDDVTILKHRVAIWYIFTSVVGHYVTCVFTDTSVKRQDQVIFANNNEVQTNNQHSDNATLADGKKTNARRRETNISETLTSAKRKRMVHCGECRMYTSPRSHHCHLCEQCIEKRDHHCFFMGVCIGRENHIYFIFFTLTMGMGTFYGLMLISKYLYYLYGIQFYGPQTFISLFFKTMTLLISGQIPSIRYLALFVLLYISLAGTMVGFGFFGWQILIVCNGQTSYEAARGITKYAKDSYLANFRSVFNCRSLVSMLLPFWDLVTDTNYCRIREEKSSRGAKTDVAVKPRRNKIK